MSITTVAARATFAVLATTVGIVVLPAIPARAESAAVTIGQLEAQGLDVRVDRVGSGSLDQCVVTSVRNPQERTELIRVNGRGGRDRVIPVVVSRSVTVSLDCSNR